jgi:murein DD-endopeptidase MepM/ murein hydrolase activator NlpD
VLKYALKELPQKHKLILSVLIASMLLFSLFPSEPASASRHTGGEWLEVGKRYPIDLNVEASAQPLQFDEEQNQSKTIRVGKGDTLAKIFKQLNLSPQETYRVSRAGQHAKKLLKMKPGESLIIDLDEQQNFVQLSYPYSSTETLRIRKIEGSDYTSDILVKQIDTRLNYAQGEIKSSFWNAAVKANLADKHIMRLAGIFGWDIDFALEIREGDSFNVIFEEQYIDGEYVGNGDIVAAEFVNQGETFTAIKYQDGNYYTPEGNSMRKSFLRAPVSFKYISSSFKKRRFHPVQKRWKAHRGVDYAANRGTPVMAAGDGKVIKAAYDKYNGHHVFIQHCEKYVTKYLHFTKRTVKRGNSVKQGQVIGYVGSTGLASGPHLHYEFLVNGVHRNPRTVELPKAQPIASKDSKAFKQIAASRVEQLSNNKRIMLAMN